MKPPEMVLMPRLLIHAGVMLLIAHVLDSWPVMGPWAVGARIMAAVCVVSYGYTSWRWGRCAARQIRDEDS